MKLKFICCLLGVYCLYSFCIFKICSNVPVVGVRLMSSNDDVPFTRPNGPKQGPRSLPVFFPDSAFQSANSFADLSTQKELFFNYMFET